MFKDFSINFIRIFKQKLFGHSHHILHNKFPPFFIFSLYALSFCFISMCSSNKNLPIIILLLLILGSDVEWGGLGGLMEIGFAVHSLFLIPPHLFCVYMCFISLYRTTFVHDVFSLPSRFEKIYSFFFGDQSGKIWNKKLSKGFWNKNCKRWGNFSIHSSLLRVLSTQDHLRTFITCFCVRPVKKYVFANSYSA